MAVEHLSSILSVNASLYNWSDVLILSFYPNRDFGAMFLCFSYRDTSTKLVALSQVLPMKIVPSMTKKALLLANLGSPDEPNTQAVRRYLDQFLMDPLVIQLPWIIRRSIVSLFVLPKRPEHSALAYQSIWTEDGSPLLVYSEKLKSAVQQRLEAQGNDTLVYMAMRYGNPSIESQLLDIAKNKTIKEILFAPLYPHYAESTFTTSVNEVERVIADHQLDLKVIIKPAFYNDQNYIRALVESCAPYIFERATTNDSTRDPDDRDALNNGPHVLFSYHGLPELHLTRADPTGKHCLKTKDCCNTPSTAHNTCYRHQVLETTRLFVESTGLKPEQYSISFQSRLGRAKWLEPSTENKLIELTEKGVRDVVVLCPAFVTDCLETLEEIAIRGKQTFTQAGGRSLRLIPCLNDHPDWVDVVAGWAEA